MKLGRMWTLLFVLLFLVLLDSPCAMSGVQPEILTAEERQWLAEHENQIILAPTPAWPPIDFYDDQGSFSGYVADYTELLQEKLQIHFKIVRTESFSKRLEALKERNIDIASTLTNTPERNYFLTNTSPYLKIPIVIIARNHMQQNLDLKDAGNMKLVITAKHFPEQQIREKYPYLNLSDVENEPTGLRMVATGEADAMIVDLAVASYAMEKDGITNLRVVNDTGFYYQSSYGVRSDWPILVSIINKGMAAITEKERNGLLQKWVHAEVQKTWQTKEFWLMVSGILGAGLLFILIVIVWNRSLRRQVSLRTQELNNELIERKKAEGALISSEEKFSKVFRHSADVIGIIRLRDGIYLEINNAFIEKFGYHREEIIGYSSLDFQLWKNALERAKLYRMLESSNTKALQNIETTWRTRSGQIRIGLNSIELIKINGESCIVYIWKDITERKKAEQDLKNTNEELEKKVGERTKELFTANQELTAMNQEHLAMNETLVETNDKLRNTNQILQVEIRERERIENQLKQKNIELNKAYTEIKNAQSKIVQQEKMASIGQLAAGVAHEINNPMGFIISNLESLEGYTCKITDFFAIQEESLAALKELCPSSKDQEKLDVLFSKLKESKRKAKIDYIIGDTKDLIKETLEGAGRVKDIVTNLKGFARVAEETMLANINEGIESTLNIIWNEIKYKANVVKEFGDIPLINCNQGQLNQVFMNILINAAQAIDSQGDIRIQTCADLKHVFVRISDTGVGIPPEISNRIFEPFFTTKDVGKGTGLGLSISYDIIKKHGGEITLESEIGKGSTFTIKIPRTQ